MGHRELSAARRLLAHEPRAEARSSPCSHHHHPSTFHQLCQSSDLLPACSPPLTSRGHEYHEESLSNSQNSLSPAKSAKHAQPSVSTWPRAVVFAWSCPTLCLRMLRRLNTATSRLVPSLHSRCHAMPCRVDARGFPLPATRSYREPRSRAKAKFTQMMSRDDAVGMVGSSARDVRLRLGEGGAR